MGGELGLQGLERPFGLGNDEKAARDQDRPLYPRAVRAHGPDLLLLDRRHLCRVSRFHEHG